MNAPTSSAEQVMHIDLQIAQDIGRCSGGLIVGLARIVDLAEIIRIVQPFLASDTIAF